MSIGRPLTPAQREQLAMLHAAGAISRASGKGPFDLPDCNPQVIGFLRNKGLADSRTVRAGEGGGMHGQFTAYWLTDRGVRAAKALATEAGA